MIIFILGGLDPYIIYIHNDFKYYKIIVVIVIFILLFFMTLIFNEIFEPNFYGMAKNTKKNIAFRPKLDGISIDFDNDNESEFFDDGYMLDLENEVKLVELPKEKENNMQLIPKEELSSN